MKIRKILRNQKCAETVGFWILIETLKFAFLYACFSAQFDKYLLILSISENKCKSKKFREDKLKTSLNTFENEVTTPLFRAPRPRLRGVRLWDREKMSSPFPRMSSPFPRMSSPFPRMSSPFPNGVLPPLGSKVFFMPSSPAQAPAAPE